MTGPSHELPDIDPLTREAIDWVVRLQSGQATTDDAAAIQRWCCQSPAHEAAFRRAVTLWRDFRIVAERSPDDDLAVQGSQNSQPWIYQPLARRAFLGGALATSVAGYMVVRPPLGLWPSWTELSADYRTSKGEQRQVALGQDVSLTLNTQTSVAVRSRLTEPQIELISGEAVITTKAPLVVIARGGRIVASQANFNARCIDVAVSVACLAGTVDVERGSQSVRLRVGQQISYSPDGLELAVAVDPAQTTSWQSGLLIFHDKSLSDVVEEINRYRPGRIIITNDGLRRRIVNATFHLDRLDNFFIQAQELFGANVTKLPAGVALLS